MSGGGSGTDVALGPISFQLWQLELQKKFAAEEEVDVATEATGGSGCGHRRDSCVPALLAICSSGNHSVLALVHVIHISSCTA